MPGLAAGTGHVPDGRRRDRPIPPGILAGMMARPTAGAVYDEIGRTYAATRRADPRIQAAIWAALGDVGSVAKAPGRRPIGRTALAPLRFGRWWFMTDR
jgi:hypothetical protein